MDSAALATLLLRPVRNLFCTWLTGFTACATMPVAATELIRSASNKDNYLATDPATCAVVRNGEETRNVGG